MREHSVLASSGDAPTSDQPAVDVKDLKVMHRGRPLIDGVTFRANSQEVTAIVGPNGAGKSTVLKAVTSALKPAQGSVELFGTPVSTLTMKQRARLRSVVSQQHDDGVTFPVWEMVAMGWDAGAHQGHRELRSEAVRAALSTAGVGELESRRFCDLSGGQQRRVLLARAIAQGTQLMVLDEPTNHLDLAAQIRLVKLLRSLPCSVLLSVHDINLARRYADRIVMMSEGKVVHEGRAAEVLTAECVAETFQVQVDVVAHPRDGTEHFLFGAVGGDGDDPGQGLFGSRPNHLHRDG